MASLTPPCHLHNLRTSHVICDCSTAASMSTVHPISSGIARLLPPRQPSSPPKKLPQLLPSSSHLLSLCAPASVRRRRLLMPPCVANAAVMKKLATSVGEPRVVIMHGPYVGSLELSYLLSLTLGCRNQRESRWVSKVIKKKHNSSVTSVAWHPNNNLLATTCADGKCRVFTTFIKGVDSRNGSEASSDLKFGEQLMQLDLSFAWTFGVKWSPRGNTLAYAGHNSVIYFIDDVGPDPSAQSVPFRDLPVRDILFVSERMAIGVGFDCSPMVFIADKDGIWSFSKFLGERKSLQSNTKHGSQLGFGKLYGQSKYEIMEPSRTPGATHDNCITCIMPLRRAADGVASGFSTSGLDGKVVIWNLNDNVVR